MKRLVLLLLPLTLGACLLITPLAPLVTPAATPTARPTPTLTVTPDAGFIVEYHPEGRLVVGDRVSLVIYPRAGQDVSGQEVLVRFAGQDLGRGSFDRYGVGGRNQATLLWIWDTTGLAPGPHTLDFSLSPGGPAWQETLTLLPAADLPEPERGARWESFTTDCCVLQYITNTEAERDLALLAQQANTQSEIVEERMRADFRERVSITFLPRTLGHGGFATDSIFVSYLDANYAGGQPELVIRHEMVHIMDRQLGGKQRPSILVEGLATYISGGHFKEEPIAPRAAALLDLGWYIPLRQLTDNFYPSQHEIGYLQGAALVQYLIETYGWQGFNNLYRNIEPAESDSAALDAALRLWLDTDFDALEADFIAWLRAQPQDPAYARDVTLTVRYYDTVRRYQQLLDPSAYFMTAWLPDVNAMRTRGIVADYMRRPQSAIHTGLEAMFLEADAALRAGQYDACEQVLKSINVMLNIVEKER
ncbi:MAG: hypothetical protein WHV44_08450 [Anaerolineales bacterium]